MCYQDFCGDSASNLLIETVPCCVENVISSSNIFCFLCIKRQISSFSYVYKFLFIYNILHTAHEVIQ